MRDFFEFNDYRELLRYTISNSKYPTRGLSGKIAEYLNISPSALSQILSGKREVSEDQVIQLSNFFSLSDDQQNFFLFLVLSNRATNASLKEIYNEKIHEIRNRKGFLESRVSEKTTLTDEEKGIYYSNWVYSAVKNLLATNGAISIKDISNRLEVEEEFIKKVIQTLERFNLVTYNLGEWKLNSKTTYLPPDSIYTLRHLQNWRSYSLHRVLKRKHPDMFFTSLFSLSLEDWLKLRENFILEIEKMYKKIEDSSEEELVCLNIDLFRI